MNNILKELLMYIASLAAGIILLSALAFTAKFFELKSLISVLLVVVFAVIIADSRMIIFKIRKNHLKLSRQH